MSAWSARQLARSSLKLYLRFGEASGTTLEDAGPNSLDGTYAASGITFGAAGLVADDADTAATFDASSDPATVPDDAALDLGDVFTIKFLISRGATRSALQTILNKGTAAYLVRFNAANRVALVVGATVVATATATMDDQLKHHVAVKKDGATTKIFIDGVEGTTAGTNVTGANTANVLRIGHSAAGTTRLPATLDELTIDNVALDDAYIAEDAAIARSLYGTASLSGEASLSAAGVRALAGAAALESAVDLSAAGYRARLGAAVLSGESDLQAVGRAILAGAANLSGEGMLGAQGVRALAGAAQLEGTSDLQASGVRARLGAADLAGELALVAEGIRARAGQAALEGALELAAAGAAIFRGAASLIGELVLTLGTPGMGLVEGRSGSSSLDRVGAASGQEAGGSHLQDVEPRGGATGLLG